MVIHYFVAKNYNNNNIIFKSIKKIINDKFAFECMLNLEENML